MKHAVHLLHRASQRAEEIFTIKCDHKELTPRQWTVLDAIAGSNLPSQTDLVALTGVDRSTLADIVKRLVQRGLVHRRRTEQDARAYQLALTAKGEEEREVAAAAAQAADDVLLSSLSPNEREMLLVLLQKVIDASDDSRSEETKHFARMGD
ncbi:MAG: MarR family winged helix-turn-helix transcriptional regulator [Hyphomicrobiaceae bacterium]